MENPIASNGKILGLIKFTQETSLRRLSFLKIFPIQMRYFLLRPNFTINSAPSSTIPTTTTPPEINPTTMNASTGAENANSIHDFYDAMILCNVMKIIALLAIAAGTAFAFFRGK